MGLPSTPGHSSLHINDNHSQLVAALPSLCPLTPTPVQVPLDPSRSCLHIRTFPGAHHLLTCCLWVSLLKFLGKSLLCFNPTKGLVSLGPGNHPCHSSLARTASEGLWEPGQLKSVGKLNVAGDLTCIFATNVKGTKNTKLVFWGVLFIYFFSVFRKWIWQLLFSR